MMDELPQAYTAYQSALHHLPNPKVRPPFVINISNGAIQDSDQAISGQKGTFWTRHIYVKREEE